MSEAIILSHERMLPISERVLGASAIQAEKTTFLPTAYYTLTGRTVTYEEFIDQYERLIGVIPDTTDDSDLYGMPPETLDDAVLHMALDRLAAGNYYRQDNVLSRWPAYQNLYERIVLPDQNTERSGLSKYALQIGGFTLSSAAFKALAKDIFRVHDENAYVVDAYVNAFGRNIAMNGFNLPEQWDNTMDIVLTNSLLHMLLGPDGRPVQTEGSSLSSMVAPLFKSIYRVLRPGGHLLMCEFIPGYDTALANDVSANLQCRLAFEEQIRQCVADIGYVLDTLESVKDLEGDFLNDQTRDFSQYDVSPPRPSTVMICAHK